MAISFTSEAFNEAGYDAALQSQSTDDLRVLVSFDIGGVFYRFVVDNRDLLANGLTYTSNAFLSFPNGFSSTAGNQADVFKIVFDIGDLQTASGDNNLINDLTQQNLRGANVQVLMAFIEHGEAIAARLKFVGMIEKAPVNYENLTVAIDVLSYDRIARNNVPLLSLPVSHEDRFGVDDKSLEPMAALSSKEILWNGFKP